MWYRSDTTIIWNRPSPNNLKAKELVQQRTTKWPHSFMFQYPPSHLNTRTLPVSSCLRLFPVVAFCGFLWPFVASCDLLRLFVASSRTIAIFRECPRLSQSVPTCPRLSDSVPFCPGNNFFHSGSVTMHKILSYFFLCRGSLVSEEFRVRTRKKSTVLLPAIRWQLV